MLTQVLLWLKSLGLSEEAQGLAEYALILVLVALAVIVGLTLLGTNINALLSNIGGRLTP